MYYGYPPPFGYPPSIQVPGENPFETWHKVQEFLEKEKQKKEESDKKKKKPEPRRFTFLETLGLTMFMGPLVGYGYLYTVKMLLIEVDKLIK